MFQLNEAICCECSYFVDCNLLDMYGRLIANGSTLLNCHMLDDDDTITTLPSTLTGCYEE